MKTSKVIGQNSPAHSEVAHQFGLAPPPDGDRSAMMKIASGWNQAASRSLLQAEQRMAGHSDLLDRLRQARSGLVDIAALNKLAAFSRQQRGAVRKALGTAAGADRRAIVRKASEESIHIAEREGIPLDGIRAMNREYLQETIRRARPHSSSPGKLSVVPVERTPPAVRDYMAGDSRPVSADPDGLTVFTPPFSGWWWKGQWWRSGGQDPDIEIYPDPGTGAVGHRSRWEDFDASDIDAFSLEYDTSISVWYQPPRAGIVDVWIWATCASAHYDVYLEDEWGWSDSSSSMSSDFTANVSSAIDDEDRTESWSALISGDPDGATYSDDRFAPGDTQALHLVTTQPVPANLWSLLRVGTHDSRFTLLNDVSTNQFVRNRWFVNAIFARVR